MNLEPYGFKVTFEGKGGYSGENELANELLESGKQYNVVWGSMGQSATSYELEGIEGSFNSVLFKDNSELFDKLRTLTYGNVGYDL